MHKAQAPRRPGRAAQPGWVRYLLIALLIEKAIQHIVVTLAFHFNWGNIRSTVVVNPAVLMILGALVAGLFILSLWGLLTQRPWTIYLVIALAVFDLIGELVAQGTLAIHITVSFIVAALLLILSLLYLRQSHSS